mgnify:CR=1 FL=1
MKKLILLSSILLLTSFNSVESDVYICGEKVQKNIIFLKHVEVLVVANMK